MSSDLSMRERGSAVYVVMVCAVAALGGLLFGYDTGVIAGGIGFLVRNFHLDPAGQKGWAAASALIGCTIGVSVAGLLSDWLGRKKVLILSAAFFLVSAVGTAFPKTIAQFIIFRIIGGVGVGAASITSPMYIAEISPARIRGRMVSVNQLAIVTGFLIVYMANFFIAAYGTGIDRGRVAAHVAERGAILDAKAVATFIDDSCENINDVQATGFVARQGGTLEAKAVVDLLKENGVEVSELDVEVAGYGVASWPVEKGWRWMFGSESLPAVLLLVLLFFVPESPRWLTKQKRGDEALGILARVDGGEYARAELAEIKEAIALESGSLRQLLEPKMKIVLVIGIVLAVLQQVTGINVFLYFGTEIFKKMGSGTNAALLQTVVVGAVNLGFTIIAIWTVDKLGRKPLMLIGSAGMGISLLAMGLAAYFGRTELWLLLFILGYIACFAMSVGPVTWVILSEIFPTGIRGRAMGIATVCLWVANYIISQTFPMMDENRWLIGRFHHAFPFWLYGVFCAVLLIFVWRFLPETKGKSLEEIEKYWMGRMEEEGEGAKVSQSD
ncbi:MAG: sugar porter family MFS transporter [Sedimentisphaerales bacterium]|nr:sugar porter family MFS transporter [Sedimentisphaerales bacterium]